VKNFAAMRPRRTVPRRTLRPKGGRGISRRGPCQKIGSASFHTGETWARLSAEWSLSHRAGSQRYLDSDSACAYSTCHSSLGVLELRLPDFTIHYIIVGSSFAVSRLTRDGNLRSLRRCSDTVSRDKVFVLLAGEPLHHLQWTRQFTRRKSSARPLTPS
jgi:hypothetical protein